MDFKNFSFKAGFRFAFSQLSEKTSYFIKLIFSYILIEYIFSALVLATFFYFYNLISFLVILIVSPLVTIITFIMLELVRYNAIDSALKVLKNEYIEKKIFEKLFKNNFKTFLLARIWYLIKVKLVQFIFFGPVIYYYFTYFKSFDIKFSMSFYSPPSQFNNNLFLTIILTLPALYIFVKYYFTGFSIIDKSISITEDTEITKKLTKGVRWKLGIFVMLIFILNNISTNYLTFSINSFNTNILFLLILLALLYIIFLSSIAIIWEFAKAHIYMQLVNLEQSTQKQHETIDNYK